MKTKKIHPTSISVLKSIKFLFLSFIFLGYMLTMRAQTGSFPLEGFVNESVISEGLTAPIALEFLPDGRMLVLEKSGEILIADTNGGNAQTYLDISNIVNSGQERGLLDVAVPANFNPNSGSGTNFIYLFYTRSSNTNRAVIGRFEHIENGGGLASNADGNSETILWTDTDGFVGCCHYGGGLDFGPDGKLWLTSADKFNTTNGGEGPAGGDNWPPNVERTSGKIIRINTDGSIPDGTDGWPANPYVDGIVEGPYPTPENPVFGPEFTPDPSIWAYGLRNPFRAEWDEEYGYFYIGEVGGNQNISTDDIHLASLDQRGVFYGWNFYEGRFNVEPSGSIGDFVPGDFPTPDNDLADPSNGDYFSAPIFDIPHSSLTGGFVYRGNMFPNDFDGVYFYGNYEDSYIRYLVLDETGTVVQGDFAFKPSDEISGDTTNVVFLAEGTDGALYYINFGSNGGQVQRIVFEGERAPEIVEFNSDSVQGDPPLTVNFTALVADADTAIDELTWTLNFGDGTESLTGTPNSSGEISETHDYPIEGSYDAVFSITDGSNSPTLSQPITITVGDPNDPPTFETVTASTTFGDPPLTVTFNATVQDEDIDDDVTSLVYVLDFGDGSPAAEGNPDINGNIQVVYTYSTPSLTPYNAILTISDGEAPPVVSDVIPIQVGPTSALPVTDGLVFQVESFIKIGLNGSTVTEWLDQSGGGNNLAALGDPQLVENATPTNMAAIVLDGTDDYLFRNDGAGTPINGFSIGSAPRTMFFVVDYDAVTNDEYAGLAYGTSANNQAFGLTLAGNTNNLSLQGWGGGNDRDTNINGVLDPTTNQERGFISHAVVYDGSNYVHYLNGIEIDSGARSYNTALDRLWLGQNLNGGFTPMAIAGAFIYNRALNASEFTAVENYIQSTYLAPSTNTAPVATDDDFSATTGDDLFVPSSTGLLSNDSDDGTFSISLVNGSPIGDSPFTLENGGNLELDLNGAFTYTSAADFVGTETFTYTISDGTLTDDANVTFTVSADNTGGLPVLDGLVAQLESDLNVIRENNDAIVTEWLSVAGTNMDLVATGDPTLVENATPSGQAAISLDGEGDWLERVNLSPELPVGDAPRSIYFVVDYKAIGTFAGVSYGTGASNQAFGLVLNGGNGNLTVQGFGGGNDLITTEDGIGNNDGSTGDDWFVHSVRYDGTTIKHYKDDVLIDEMDRSDFATVFSRFVIGEEIAGAGNGEELDVAAVLVYNKEVDDVEHGEILQYLTNKYLDDLQGGNTAPVAVDDDFSATTGEDLDIETAAGLLANDSDDGTFSISLVNGSPIGDSPFTLENGGNLELDLNGAFTYTSAADFVGTETFTYTISDGTLTDDANVTFTVSADNTSGLPVLDGLVAQLEADLNVNTAPDSNDAIVTEWRSVAGTNIDLVATGDPTLVENATPSGQAAISLDGEGDWLERINLSPELPVGDAPRSIYFVVDYKAVNTFAGVSYGTGANNQAFGLVLNGGNGNLTVQGFGGGNDLITTEDGIGNNDGSTGDDWFVHSVRYDGTTIKHYKDDVLIDEMDRSDFATVFSRFVIGEEIAGAGNGEELDVAAVLVYNKEVDDVEHGEILQYLTNKYLDDLQGGNTAPVAVDDDFSATTGEDLDIETAAGLLANDSDDGTFSISLVNGSPIGDSPFTLENGGNLELDLNGAFTYTSAADFVGTETFTYTISDGTLTDDANVTFTVSADNTSGLPVLDGLVAQLEADLNVITAPDSNVVTDWRSVAGINIDLVATGDPTLVENATPSGQAAISLDGEGDWLERIIPSPELPVGDAPRSIYFVVDYKAVNTFAGVSYGTGANNQAFGLVLNGGNGNLTVQGFGGGNDLITTEDGIGNNDGSTGDDWFVHSVRYDGTTIKHYKDDVLIDEMDRSDFATVFSRFVIGEEIAGAGNGEELDVAAVLVYNKEVDDVEHGEILQYLTNKYLDDLQGGNTAPVAVDDDFSATTGEDLDIETAAGLLANDSDDGTFSISLVNGSPIGDSPFTLENGGNLELDLNGAFTYTSAADFVGTETFTYTISDGTLTDDANVTFTVSADNTSGLPVLDGLVAQLEADLNVITAPDSNVVTDWRSVAGINIDLVATGDPTLVENATPSGQAAISLDGEGDWLERIIPSPELPVGDAPRSIYFVVDYKAVNTFAGVSYGTGANNQAFGLVLNGGNGNLTVQGFGGGNDLITTEDGIGNNDGSTGDDWFVHSVRYDGTTIKHYKDDVLIDEMDRSDFATVFSRFVIGEEIAGAGNGEELDVAAVLVYNKEVDDVEHGEILQYLTNKYLE